MQRVSPVPGGVNAYQENSRVILTAENRACPFCPDGHCLRIHGTYQRQALFPDRSAPETLTIHRLLCVRRRRTVSLLPDFCLPRRQHGPSILALFLLALLEGAGLLKAIRSVRGEVRHHSTAQALLRGFLQRGKEIQTYLARVRHRALGPPKRVPPEHRLLGALFYGLVHGFHDPSSAFTFHGSRFHERYQLGLA